MRKNFTIIFLFAGLLSVNAQKLPNKQETNFPAPAGVKIDGKINEWGDHLQAYNNAVDVYYTVANDDRNLYLVVKAIKPRIVDKIIDVGLTFTINKQGKKSDDAKEKISFTYPLIDVASGQRIIINAGKKIRSGVAIPLRDGKPVIKDTTANLPASSDSTLEVANNLFLTNAKEIKIANILGNPGVMASIYNEENIKVAAAFDKQGAYNYELAIPLSYLQLSTGDFRKISYSIRLDSRLLEPKKDMRTQYVYIDRVMTDVDQDLDSTTDFWGEYTFAKK